MFKGNKEMLSTIRPSKSDATLMLTLPRNESGFKALISTLISYRDKCHIDFTNAAIRNVFDSTIQLRALTLSGKVDALNDVIDLLDRLTVGGIDNE